jgi:hypothetical protein
MLLLLSESNITKGLMKSHYQYNIFDDDDIASPSKKYQQDYTEEYKPLHASLEIANNK